MEIKGYYYEVICKKCGDISTYYSNVDEYISIEDMDLEEFNRGVECDKCSTVSSICELILFL